MELVGEYMELPGSAVFSLQTGSKTSYNMCTCRCRTNWRPPCVNCATT